MNVSERPKRPLGRKGGAFARTHAPLSKFSVALVEERNAPDKNFLKKFRRTGPVRERKKTGNPGAQLISVENFSCVCVNVTGQNSHVGEPVVHLSLNQGTTKLRNEFGGRTREILHDRADLMRKGVAEFSTTLSVAEIDLGSKITKR